VAGPTVGGGDVRGPDAPAEIMQRLKQTDLGNEIEFLAARARSIGNARANSRLAPLDLKVRSYSVLALACSTSGPSQRDLAEYLCLDPSQIVALVDGLEKRGLVERVADPVDRRSKIIRGTRAGKTLYQQAAEAVRAAEDVSLRGLNDQERNTLRELLRKIAFVPAD
jgi:DNA-binding MarR family transcriptional regulator